MDVLEPGESGSERNFVNRQRPETITPDSISMFLHYNSCVKGEREGPWWGALLPQSSHRRPPA